MPYYQQEAGQSADKPEIVDYTDLARISGDKATEEQRQRLAPQFNQIIREPTSTLHLTASKLEPTFDLSRYVETADLTAMVEGSCDFDCKTRIKQQLDNVAEGTTQVGDMSVKVKPAPAPKPLSDAELTRIADNIRTGKFSNLTSGLTEEDLEKVKQKVGAAAPPAPPKPKNVQ